MLEIVRIGARHRSVAWTVVPNLTWWQSEWVYVRGEWQHDSMPLGPGVRNVTNRFLVQIVWAIGPHKHETY